MNKTCCHPGIDGSMSLIVPVCRTTCWSRMYICAQQRLGPTPTIAASIWDVQTGSRIEQVALIEAVVDVEAAGIATVKWQHGDNAPK